MSSFAPRKHALSRSERQQNRGIVLRRELASAIFATAPRQPLPRSADSAAGLASREIDHRGCRRWTAGRPANAGPGRPPSGGRHFVPPSRRLHSWVPNSACQTRIARLSPRDTRRLFPTKATCETAVRCPVMVRNSTPVCASHTRSGGRRRRRPAATIGAVGQVGDRAAMSLQSPQQLPPRPIPDDDVVPLGKRELLPVGREFGGPTLLGGQAAFDAAGRRIVDGDFVPVPVGHGQHIGGGREGEVVGRLILRLPRRTGSRREDFRQTSTRRLFLSPGGQVLPVAGHRHVVARLSVAGQPGVRSSESASPTAALHPPPPRPAACCPAQRRASGPRSSSVPFHPTKGRLRGPSAPRRRRGSPARRWRAGLAADGTRRCSPGPRELATRAPAAARKAPPAGSPGDPPDAHRTALVATGHAASVGRKGDFLQTIEMLTQENPLMSPRTAQAGDAHRTVRVAGRHQSAIRRNGQALDVAASCPVELVHALACGQVPDLQIPVAIAADQPLAVGRHAPGIRSCPVRRPAWRRLALAGGRSAGSSPPDRTSPAAARRPRRRPAKRAPWRRARPAASRRPQGRIRTRPSSPTAASSVPSGENAKSRVVVSDGQKAETRPVAASRTWIRPGSPAAAIRRPSGD